MGLSHKGAGVKDHGALDGLSDDDHTQYILVDGTRDLTGSQNTQNLLPVTDVTYTLGNDSFRYDNVYVEQANADETVSGAPASSDTVTIKKDITITSGFNTNTHRALFIDYDHDVNSAGAGALDTACAIDVDMDLTTTVSDTTTYT